MAVDTLLRQLIAPHDVVIVGVSGGPDSMMLLSLLQQLAKQIPITLCVVHLNHQIRPEAAEDAQFVSDYCQRNQIDCRVIAVDVIALAQKEKLSVEEAGHRARFAAFVKVRQEIGANKLALGHHKNDRAETVLLHFLKGTGLEGLAVMPPQDGWIVRPLITLSKDEILAYCTAHHLPYCIDATNAHDDYLRNKIRLSLLPQLRETYNNRLDDALIRLAILSGEDKDYWQQATLARWQQMGSCDEHSVCLDLSQWQTEPLSLKRRLLRYAYQLMRPQSQGLSFGTVELLMALAEGNNGSKTLHLPEGICAHKCYGRLCLAEKNEAESFSFCYEWSLNETLHLLELGLCFQAEFSEQPFSKPTDFWTIVVDGDKLPSVLTVRQRREGDNLQPLGMKGRKKVKNYFIDQKVPQNYRHQIPLVFADKELLWLVGYTFSEGFRINQQTKFFCRLSCFREN